MIRRTYSDLFFKDILNNFFKIFSNNFLKYFQIYFHIIFQNIFRYTHFCSLIHIFFAHFFVNYHFSRLNAKIRQTKMHVHKDYRFELPWHDPYWLNSAIPNCIRNMQMMSYFYSCCIALLKLMYSA